MGHKFQIVIRNFHSQHIHCYEKIIFRRCFQVIQFTTSHLPFTHLNVHGRSPHLSRHEILDDASSEIFFYYKKNIFFIVKKWHAKILLHHLHTFILDSYK